MVSPLHFASASSDNVCSYSTLAHYLRLLITFKVSNQLLSKGNFFEIQKTIQGVDFLYITENTSDRKVLGRKTFQVKTATRTDCKTTAAASAATTQNQFASATDPGPRSTAAINDSSVPS